MLCQHTAVDIDFGIANPEWRTNICWQINLKCKDLGILLYILLVLLLLFHKIIVKFVIE